MMAVMCLFTAAMVWCNEPIKIHVHPPTGVQLGEYIALRDRHPSGAQAQILGGETVSQSSPSELQGSQPQLHLTLRELDNAQVREVVDEMQLETTRREGIAP